ncbi:hypothetical protein GW17_00052620, partial [Ensete ventricosum]
VAFAIAKHFARDVMHHLILIAYAPLCRVSLLCGFDLLRDQSTHFYLLRLMRSGSDEGVLRLQFREDLTVVKGTAQSLLGFDESWFVCP